MSLDGIWTELFAQFTPVVAEARGDTYDIFGARWPF